MGQKILTTCDQCDDECDCYIGIEKGFLCCANGAKMNGASIGFESIDLSDKVFCSITCLVLWHRKESDKDQIGSYFPGEQIGLESINGKMGK